MANDKRFVVKNGLQTQDINFESPDKTKNITASMLNTDVLSFSNSSNTELMRIDSTGRVGIGITLPTSKLHVVGTARVTEEVYGKVLFSTGGMILNTRVISNSYTVIANNNAMSTGPIEISNGVTITISDGARWVVM